MKKEKTTTFKFENWKSGKQAVVRNAKGQFISKTKVKGSGKKTKAQFIKQFKETGSLAKGVKVLSFKNSEIKGGKNLTIRTKDKDGKIVTTLITEKFNNAILIGKNTALIRSDKKLKGYKHFQYVVRLKVKDVIAVGYSELTGKRAKDKNGLRTGKYASFKQAFDRALGTIIEKTPIKYDWVIDITDVNSGTATSPNGNTIINFTFTKEVATYVRTN